MRNDVKLGFAIGGVLLAVLIVYVLVVPGGTEGKKVTQSSGASTLARGNGGGVTLEPVPAPAAVTTPAVPAPLGDRTPSEPAKTNPFAPKTTSDPVAQSQSPGSDLDWNKLLNDQPVLMIDTPVQTGAKVAAVAAKPAPAPVTTPTPEAVAQAPTPVVPMIPAPVSEAVVQAAPTGSTALIDPNPPTVPPTGARSHKVQQGETLSSISTAEYGNPNQYPAILKANPGLDPTRMRVGQTINLPDLSTVAKGDAVAQPAAGRVAPQIDPTREYRVVAGDSLHRISQKLYGDIGHAEKIFELNASAMSNDRHKLRVGQVIQLPQPPTAAATTSSAAR